MNYKQKTVMGQTIIWYEQDGFLVSFGENPDNTDYQAYLEWVAAGNEPEIIET